MQQRKEAHDSLDDFPTPPWATRALCAYLEGKLGHDLASCSVREPACNRGHMVAPLGEYFAEVIASDVFDYGAGYPQADYLFGDDANMADWTITNPPFRLAVDFIEQAMRFSDVGVAMFVRTSFLEGDTRFRKLFSKYRPAHILQFTSRVIIHRGVLRNPAVKYFDPDMNDGEGGMRSPSSATSYCWLIFLRGHGNDTTHFDWLSKPRSTLERPGDYPGLEEVK